MTERRRARLPVAIFWIALALAMVRGADAAACGVETDCALGDRSYRILMPEHRPGDGRIGALIYLHGYRGKAARSVHSKGLTALAADLGVAVVVPEAAGPEWISPGVPSHDWRDGVDDLAFFDALADEVARRFPIDRARIVVTGFSSGAMMVWHLACKRGDAFAGYVPMSGTFWAPVPETCPGGPVNLVHYHGTADTVVPLAGRVIEDAHQGDVHAAMALMTRVGRYSARPAEAQDGLDCSRKIDAAGHLLELCLFSGKHQWKARHVARAARLFGLAPAGE